MYCFVHKVSQLTDVLDYASQQKVRNNQVRSSNLYSIVITAIFELIYFNCEQKFRNNHKILLTLQFLIGDLLFA